MAKYHVQIEKLHSETRAAARFQHPPPPNFED
jgi:hypothetical protein